MLIPKRRPILGTVATLLFIIAVIAAGILGSATVYRSMDASGRSHILDRAATIAEAIPVEKLAALTGAEADIGTEAYEDIKNLLIRTRLVNHDARFVYLMGRTADGALFFFADSEDPQSEDYSPPGQLYFEASDGMHEVFKGRVVSEGPDADRWGVWISAYAPVRDAAGVPLALLGVDLPADAFLADLYIYSALPLISSAVILLILLLAIEARRRERARLEKQEEFLSIASHEVRSPLSGIAWALAQFAKRSDLNSEDRARLALMHEGALRLVARLNNLLDFSGMKRAKDRVLKLEHFDASDILRGIGTMLALPAEARSVTLTLPKDPIPMKADKQMLHHAMFNLIGNAVKFTRPGTAVIVRYVSEKDTHIFTVSDEGEGIPPSEHMTVFSGYHRVKGSSDTSGTGLGLFMAKRAVELHGGTITLESTVGKGTTFTVRIPKR